MFHYLSDTWKATAWTLLVAVFIAFIYTLVAPMPSNALNIQRNPNPTAVQEVSIQRPIVPVSFGCETQEQGSEYLDAAIVAIQNQAPQPQLEGCYQGSFQIPVEVIEVYQAAPLNMGDETLLVLIKVRTSKGDEFFSLITAGNPAILETFTNKVYPNA
jgi:hypothetical protein